MQYYHEKPVKIQISVTLDEDIVKKLKELAYNDDRTLSTYINRILKKEITNIDSDTKQ